MDRLTISVCALERCYLYNQHESVIVFYRHLSLLWPTLGRRSHSDRIEQSRHTVNRAFAALIGWRMFDGTLTVCDWPVRSIFSM